MERGFYVVITLDRMGDLQKFLPWLKKYNKYPILVAIADDAIDAFRKKTMVGFLSPFDATVYLDTDVLVNGNLDYMFEVAENGKIGIYRETSFPICNAGILVIPKEVKKSLSEKWLPLYNAKRKHAIGDWDQDILNSLLPQFPVCYLPREYNCILSEITPEQEREMFPRVKLFHFLHHGGVDRSKYKSWRIYQGLESI
jgi:alpha-N-acetylglucosamine transferase